ncbi:MAG: hypothetical protein WC722_05825 [Rhodospirillales bacterium]|jgi:hypothetical protein
MCQVTIVTESPTIHVVKAPLSVWQACGQYGWIVNHPPGQMYQIAYQTAREAKAMAHMLEAVVEAEINRVADRLIAQTMARFSPFQTNLVFVDFPQSANAVRKPQIGVLA